MIFDASPCPARPRPSRVAVIAAVAALAYPALFAAAANVPPVWLWFRTWEAPRPPLFVSRLVDPARLRESEPPHPKRSRRRRGKESTPTPARPFPPPPRRQPAVQIAEVERPAGPPVPVPAQPASRCDLASYEPLGRQDGRVPRIVIDTSFEDYAPVMRAYNAELALGLSYPGPNRNTWLYSLNRGELHQGVPARGAVPRLLRTALVVDALKPVVQDVANRLGAGAESIRVYALYPEELHYGLVGKVRDALARAGAPPDSCAVVSFRPFQGGFDVEVHPLAQCP